MLDNPCYNQKTKTSCPRRAPGCTIACPDWAKYTKERDKIYEARAKEQEKRDGFYDIGKNRAIYTRKKHRGHGSK